MNKKSTRFKVIDGLLIAMMILPLLAAVCLKVLYSPASEGIEISGALIYLQFDKMPLQPLIISEAQVNSWAVIITILGLCLYLTHGLTEKAETKRQLVAEWIVEKVEGLVGANMEGEKDIFGGYAPFICAIMGISGFSSLACLIGLFSPTGDVNVTAGWAILVFIIITYYKLKGGLGKYLIGFTKPVPLFTPMNIIGEFATPVSMAFRHYGNVLSGAVISVLIGAAPRGLSAKILGFLPGVLGDFPLFQIGIPAVFSIYFDVFSGLMQAFIFAMLTMLNIAGAVPWEDWDARRAKKEKRKQKKAAEMAV